MPRRIWILQLSGWSLALAMMVSGCAPLNSSKSSAGPLNSSRLPPDAVVFDVAFVRLKAADVESYDAIWSAADEQRLDVLLRGALERNGVRAGVLGQQFPAKLRELIDTQPKLLAELSQGQPDELDFNGARHHLPLRAGHRSIIKASKVFPSLPVLLSEEGTLRGYQLTDARCTLSLKSHPLGDGRVKLSLTPEIEHGELKARWGGSEGMMIQQTSQDRLILDRLALEAMLGPGQSLLVSTTPEIKGLGEYFFSQHAGGAVERRLLVIRYAQTQFDNLFAPEQTSAPLATPGE
ncbi:MAG: hypothetical protein JF612_10615 [Planctomycetia bacterium]|nr:hypothetical protein [Planctomycetia bacterium]